LIRWAASEQVLSEKQDDGHTLRVHLEAIERKQKMPHALLSGRKPLMQKARYLWHWWLEMRSNAGSDSVTAATMQDWQWLTGNRLNMYERRIIATLESHWRRGFD
jgi:hypothetical protein